MPEPAVAVASSEPVPVSAGRLPTVRLSVNEQIEVPVAISAEPGPASGSTRQPLHAGPDTVVEASNEVASSGPGVGQSSGPRPVVRTSDGAAGSRVQGTAEPRPHLPHRNPSHESRQPDGPEISAARLEAQRILDEARHEASNLRREAERYVQQVLAELEADIKSSLGTVRGGRQYLAQKRRRPEA